MGVSIPREQLGATSVAVSGLKSLKAGLSPGPEALVPGAHPRCSVCPSAWKSTSCPFRSWPTAVLADITFTNLVNEPEGREGWLTTGPSGSLLGSAYHFLSVCGHSPSSSPRHLAACLDVRLPASPLFPPPRLCTVVRELF